MTYIDEDGDYFDLSDFSCGECSHFDSINCFCWLHWKEVDANEMACEDHDELQYMQKVKVLGEKRE
jgi:hypothetical protein